VQSNTQASLWSPLQISAPTKEFDMTTFFTLKSISADPWNAVRLDVPARANLELLQAALKAVARCVEERYDQIQAVRAGELIPEGWRDEPWCPDAHEFYEGDWYEAVKRFEELAIQSARVQFGRPN
jgi:hypothetical protein